MSAFKAVVWSLLASDKLGSDSDNSYIARVALQHLTTVLQEAFAYAAAGQ
jgi:hypothetical protein